LLAGSLYAASALGLDDLLKLGNANPLRVSALTL
jgi:hypothetical protein